MQEFGWTGTLQSDLLVYPDILEECRSEESMEESVRTVSGSRVGVVTTDMRCRDPIRDRRTHARCRLQSYNDI